MALDGANFIAELSITDPPGTDPLSQGDDQIRTIKRATFQSFPLVDAAVNLTAAQMNLMAIKNEANVFSADRQINDANLILHAVADGGASTELRRAGLLRWTTTMGLDANDNDWSLTRFDALGDFVDNPLVVSNVTGVFNFAHVPTIKGDPIWTAGEIKILVQGASLPSNNWFVCNGTNGTVDLRDRILGAQGTFTGTQTPFLDAQTDPGNAGDTTLALAQVPEHGHGVLTGINGSGTTDTTLAFSSTVLNDTVIAGNRENNNAFIIQDNNNGELFVERVGGGGSHTHDVGGLEVNPASNDAFQVMPYTYFMQAIQYVP